MTAANTPSAEPGARVHQPLRVLLWAGGSIDPAAITTVESNIELHFLHGAGAAGDGAIECNGDSAKLACRLAIETGVDWLIVALGQDVEAAAAVAGMLRLLGQTDADLLIGSRGGISRQPLLQRMAERFAGRALPLGSVRAYRTGLLRRIPFELADGGELFELEVLLQTLHVGARVSAVSVGAVGSDATRVDRRSLPPVALLRAALQFRLNQIGMLTSLKYRNLTPFRYQDKTFMMYSSHALALEWVRQRGPATLLDIGCGPGFIAGRCEQRGIRVTGVDAHEPLANMMTEFHRLDLEREDLPVEPFAFDVILLLDVLEHMADPESFLLSLRARSRAAWASGQAPTMIISTPNVAFVGIRLNLLLGRFPYAERGILDITHKRLFTRRSLLSCLRDCGYEVERVTPVGVPFQTVVGGRMGRWVGLVADLAARAWPTMFAFQFLVACRPKAGARQLLQQRQMTLTAGSVPFDAYSMRQR